MAIAARGGGEIHKRGTAPRRLWAPCHAAVMIVQVIDLHEKNAA